MGGFISMKNPKSPNHPHQKYSLTEKGSLLKISICEGVNEGVKQELNQILSFLKSNPMKKAPEIADFLKKGNSTVERYLKILKENGYITFEGSPKTGAYKIKA